MCAVSQVGVSGEVLEMRGFRREGPLEGITEATKGARCPRSRPLCSAR